MRYYRSMSKFLVLWLPQALIITGLVCVTYLGIQQSYRQGLNDPQIQMAEDGAALLSQGGVPAELVQRGVVPVDVAKSLAPWIAVYDEAGGPLESSAVLNDVPPMPPKSTFDSSTWSLRNGRDNAGEEVRYTWQPEPGVRVALVMVHFTNPNPGNGSLSSGYVVAGRNMRETEARIGLFAKTAAFAWFGLLCISALLTPFVSRKRAL